MEPMIPNFCLSTKHVMIDELLSAYVSMADARFSFEQPEKCFEPASYSPEILQKKQSDINWKAADMWSFAIVLWELATREIPFSNLPPMIMGKVFSPAPFRRASSLSSSQKDRCFSLHFTFKTKDFPLKTWVLFCRHEDRNREPESADSTRNFTSYGSSDQNLYERRSWKTTHLRANHTDFGENGCKMNISESNCFSLAAGCQQ